MRALDFSVQLRRAALDVSMADAPVFNVPVKFGLEFVTVVGANFPNPKRKFADDVIDEIDRIGLGMLVVNLERPDACCIVDRGILETSDLGAARPFEG